MLPSPWTFRFWWHVQSYRSSPIKSLFVHRHSPVWYSRPVPWLALGSIRCVKFPIHLSLSFCKNITTSPPQLCASTETNHPTRLLNIAQLANKYCIASYEAWALDRLISLAKNPNSFIRHASPEICARALHVAFLCDHQPLIDIILSKLVPRILWSSDFDRQPILQLSIKLGIPILQGVIYYRNLVQNPEQDQSAYESLVRLWNRIRTTPPSFEKDKETCTDPEHIQCLATWSNLWSTTASSEQTVTNCGDVDVLGRLKCMMIQLKKAMESRSDAMSLGCTLLALESITVARDEIVNGLIDHFSTRIQYL